MLCQTYISNWIMLLTSLILIYVIRLSANEYYKVKEFALKKHEITSGISFTHISPPQAENFKNVVHFKVLRSNLAKILTTGCPS